MKEKIIKDRTCTAHFKGSDGFGTCSSLCQWFCEGSICPNSRQKEKIKITDESRFEALVADFMDNGFTEQQAVFLINLLNNFIPII